MKHLKQLMKCWREHFSIDSTPLKNDIRCGLSIEWNKSIQKIISDDYRWRVCICYIKITLISYCLNINIPIYIKSNEPISTD
jgi:hypothetical protein